MKIVSAVVVCLLFLSGCGGMPGEIQEGMALRSSLLKAEGCRFSADITADYGDKVHTFSMDCAADEEGDLLFTVTAPETLSGISGEIQDGQGRITFEDDVALAFPLLADDQLSPVSAPWILVKTLRSGYLRAGCREEALLHLTIDDSYEEDALTLDIWCRETIPIRAEVLYDGLRILSLEVKDFALL